MPVRLANAHPSRTASTRNMRATHVTDREHQPTDVANSESLLREQVADILEQARKLGADAVEAGASVQQGLSVSVRQGDLETVEFHRDQGFGISLYFGHRKGSVSCTDSSAASIRESVAAAAAIANHIEEDPFNGLADASLMATDFPDLDLHHPWPLEPDTAEQLALRMEAAAKAVDPRITNSEGAWVGTSEGCHVYGNSHGFMAAVSSTSHSLGCTPIGTQDGAMQRDYHYSKARNSTQLEAVEEIGRKAGERTVARLGARKIPTACMPVLFCPEIARSLLGHLIAAISGGNIYREQSFLVNKIGEPVLPARYSLFERPRIPGAMGSMAFDGDGLQTREQSFIEEGDLARYVLSAYSARRLRLEPTANAGGVHNLCINDDGLSFEELLEQMQNGFLVTELLGQGVNLVTGDYSRGAAGFLIENGKSVYPVEGVTIAGNLSHMYRDVRAIGNDVDIRSNIRVGSIWVDGMTLAGS